MNSKKCPSCVPRGKGVMSSNVWFHRTNSPKPKYIQFTLTTFTCTEHSYEAVYMDDENEYLTNTPVYMKPYKHKTAPGRSSYGKAERAVYVSKERS